MPECQNCRGHITKAYTRVFGDDETVLYCRNCDQKDATRGDIYEGEAHP